MRYERHMDPAHVPFSSETMRVTVETKKTLTHVLVELGVAIIDIGLRVGFTQIVVTNAKGEEFHRIVPLFTIAADIAGLLIVEHTSRSAEVSFDAVVVELERVKDDGTVSAAIVNHCRSKVGESPTPEQARALTSMWFRAFYHQVIALREQQVPLYQNRWESIQPRAWPTFIENAGFRAIHRGHTVLHLWEKEHAA